MSRLRRRTKAGIPLGVFFALFAAIFVSRANRDRAGPESDRQRSPSAEVSPTARIEPPTATPSPRGAQPAGLTTPGFSSRRELVEHYDKHGEEVPGYSMAAYLAAAQSLRDAPDGGNVMELRRRDGVITRFDRATGAFLAIDRDGTIRTFFKPNDGEAYFRRQASRAPGGGP